jgi:hypothetical protein
MLSECKIFFNQFSQKAILLKLSSTIFLLYLMKNPAYPPEIISILICLAASFFVMEYVINVFGLDDYAFYLHFLGTRSPLVCLLRRVVLCMVIQSLLSAILSALFFFRTDRLGFSHHLFIITVLSLQTFCMGCIFSVTLPRAIPKTIEKKIFRANPGLGFTLSALLNFLVLFSFYVLCRIWPQAKVAAYSWSYILLLIFIFIPASILIAAKAIKRNRYNKLVAITTER